MLRTLGLLWVVLIVALVFQAAYAQSMEDRSLFLENQVSFIPGPAQQMWEDYTFNTLAVDDFQPGCEPMHYRPELGVPYRGVVILLHGFTSCPKQFSAMAQNLTALGYHVLLPVLPGHGRAGANEISEQYDLPGAQSWRKYDTFARWLNELAASVTEGEVQIGGLCLGATIAAQALQLQPKLYSRAVLFSPFLELSMPLLGRVGRLIGRVGEVVKISPDMNIPFALSDLETCENVERRVLGRAGYCRVRLSNLIAVARFAELVRSNWKPVSTSIQTILVNEDPVANPLTTLKVLEQDVLTADARNNTCVMNASASHSFFSPTDLPSPKPWLPELHKELGEFVSQGKSLTQTFTSAFTWPRGLAAVGACALHP